jgi:hypothetical protein
VSRLRLDARRHDFPEPQPKGKGCGSFRTTIERG